MGYALASVLPPLVAGILSQVLVVFVLMFSPLNFPADRLPDWLRAIHAVLPIQAMGESIRGSLAPTAFPLAAGPIALLTVWCVASFAVAFLALNRRG